MISTEHIVAIVMFFFLACLTGLVLTALVREVAPKLGLTDRPDGHRKLHDGATPLGGGVAILLSTISVLGVVMVQRNAFQAVMMEHWPTVSSLVLAGGIIVLVGLIDDRFGLRGWQKLLGQLVAASVLVASGLVIQRIGIFGLEIDFKWFAIPATIFWLLGAVNALNLLDGIDGLAAMVGIILVTTIAVMAAMLGQPHLEVMVIGFVFAGSLVGFMRFNFPPASIFLGDTGSMLIGLMVGALAIQGSLKGPGTVLLGAPLAVWSIPIFDSAAAIIRRKLTGRSIYTTDRGHLHHRLLSLLGSNRRVLVCLAFCCAATSGAALLSVFVRHQLGGAERADLIALLTCSAIVIIFIATGVFGRAEVVLLGNRLRRVGRSLVTPRGARQTEAHQVTVRLQGSRQWELLWETFIESVDKLGLNEVRLDVNFPAAEEEYHASWERMRRDDLRQCWRMEMPVVVQGRPIGGLVVVGRSDRASACQDIQRLLDLVEPFETKLLALSAQEMSAAGTAEPEGGQSRPGSEQDQSLVSQIHRH